MGSVIEIRFSEDLPTRLQNQLRYRMEMAAWLAEDRRLGERARETNSALDWAEVDRHMRNYELVGLP